MRLSLFFQIALGLLFLSTLQIIVVETTDFQEEILEAEDVIENTGNEKAQLTKEMEAKLMASLSKKCLAEMESNPTPESMSDRCKAEIGQKVQKYLARQARGDTGENEKPKDKPKKKKTKLTKKQKRAQREAAAARKAEEDYNANVRVVIGFVVALVTIAAVTIVIINRKLHAAGMYYMADPNAPASCCG